MIRALPRYAATAPARTWLLAIARRVWVDSIRHDMARPRSSGTDYRATVDAKASEQGSSEAAWSEWLDVRALIDALPAERREALILTQVLGYTYDEAARICGVRIGTIRSRVARARRDLIAARR